MGQTDPILTCSLLYEDKLLLQIRVERLAGQRTFSQKPKSRCHHVLQVPQVDSRDEAANTYVLWTPMHYVETRLDEQKLYAIWATHHLTVVDGRIKIKLNGSISSIAMRLLAVFSFCREGARHAIVAIECLPLF